MRGEGEKRRENKTDMMEKEKEKKNSFINKKILFML